MTRDQAWDLLCLRSDRLGVWEILALAEIAERFERGRVPYGDLDLPNDRRNWRREAYEELLDASAYLALDTIAAKLRADTEPAPPRSATCDGRDVVVVDDTGCPPFNPDGDPYVCGTADLTPDAAPTLPSTAPEGLYREVG